MSYCIQYSSITHVGLRRNQNQDNMVCNGNLIAKDTTSSEIVCGKINVKHDIIFGVFDGMGGAQCGEKASMLAAKTAEGIDVTQGKVEGFLDYCMKANAAICSYRMANKLASVGTTAAVLVFSPHNISLCNLGDTKIFRISKNRIEQISADHIMQFPGGKRYLTQNLGSSDSLDLRPYIAFGEYKRGDQYLICSDGLTDMVRENEIMQIIKENRFGDAVPMLLNAALTQGGKDNITIILCKVLHRLFG